MKKYKSLIIVLLIIVLGFTLDIVTKTAANNSLMLLERNPVINNFFYFTLCYNKGGAWSIFDGQVFFLILTSLFALDLIIFMMIKAETKFFLYSSALFVSGLLGNLYDRLVYGKVIDFLDFIIFGYNFPVFNVADCFICIGIGLICIDLIRGEIKNGKQDS